MQDNDKAKILLQYGSFQHYIEEVLEKNNIQNFMVEEYFTEEIAKASQQYDEWAIGSNWGESYADFIADGYSRDDIEYDDYDDLEEALAVEIIIDIAQYYIEKYFYGDNDLLDDVQAFIKSCL